MGTLTIEKLSVAPDALAGDVAVVTGAGRGIGREVARSLARLGARVVVAELDAEAGRETVAAPSVARALSERLEAMLAETEAELSRLPIFVRPLAKRGFKSKAELRIEDWQRTASGLTVTLREVEAGDDDAGARLRGEIPRLVPLLGSLIVYFREVPEETARFTKDEETLREIREISEARVATLESLVAALRSLG